MESKVLKILVACEESQEVCKAFRARGHEAYSNDIQECSGGYPEWHLQMDVFEALRLKQWDMLIGFPPCTYISSAGLHWCKKDKTRSAKRDTGAAFFMALWNQPIAKIALENPVGYMNTNWRAPSQIIQPFYFGDAHLKTTCLWLKGLPKLNGNHEVALNRHKFRPQPLSVDSTGKKRYFGDAFNRSSKSRSKTFPGIAKAMAAAWSPNLTMGTTFSALNPSLYPT